MTEYREYQIVGDKTFGMKTIRPSGRGTVPGELRGSFTDFRNAKLAIDKYLSEKEKKEDAPSKRRSGV